MFPHKKPQSHNVRDPRQDRADERRRAIQTAARRHLEEAKARKAAENEDEVFQQSGYGDSDSDDGIVRIPIVQPVKKATEAGIAVQKDQGSSSSRFPLSNRQHQEDVRERNRPASPRRAHGYHSRDDAVRRESQYSRDRDHRRERRRDSRDRDGHRRRHRSRSGDRDRRRRDRSRSRDNNRRERRDHSRSRSRGRGSCHRREESRERRREERAREDQAREFRRILEKALFTDKKPTHHMEDEKPAVSKAEFPLDARFILGLPSDIFWTLFGEEVNKTPYQERTFFEEVAAWEDGSFEEKMKALEAVFGSKPPTEDIWVVAKHPSILNNLMDSHTLKQAFMRNLPLGQQLQFAKEKVKMGLSHVNDVIQLIEIECQTFQKHAGVLDKEEFEARMAELLRKSIKINPTSVLLQLARTEIPRALGSKKDTISVFREILKRHPLEPIVWKKYLDFVQFTSAYDPEDMHLLFEKCLNFAHNSLRKNETEFKDRNGFCHFYLYVYLRFLKWLMARGQTPTALACIQATMELHFGVEEAEIRDRYKCLEAFWKTKMPRIGDERALGAKTAIVQKITELEIGNMETEDHRSVVADTQYAMKDHLSGTNMCQNFVAFERKMAGIDAPVKRTQMTGNFLFNEKEKKEFGAVNVREPVEFCLKEGDEIKRQVIPFFASTPLDDFDFVQPMLELLGVQFANSTGCHTTTEQVVTEWISTDTFKGTKANFQQVPTHTEEACVQVGQRILVFLIQQRHQLCKALPDVVDKTLVQLSLALVKTKMADMEKTLELYHLSNINFRTIMNFTAQGDLEEVLKTYPQLYNVVDCYLSKMLAGWIERGHAEQKMLEKLEEKRDKLPEKLFQVIEEHGLTPEVHKNFKFIVTQFMTLLGNVEAKINPQGLSLLDPSLTMMNLQFTLHNMVTRSKLYIVDSTFHEQIQTKLGTVLLEESEETIHGLRANGALFSQLQKAMDELGVSIIGRELNDGEPTLTETPRAGALCEALQIAVHFVFMRENKKPFTAVSQMADQVLAKFGVFKECQKDTMRGDSEKHQDRIDTLFVLDTFLDFVQHNSIHVIHHQDFERVILAAVELFPCSSKYMRIMAKFHTANRSRLMSFAGIVAKRNEEARQGKGSELDGTMERQLLLNGVALMFATKRYCGLLGSFGTENLIFDQFLKSAQEVQDPTLWRLVIGSAPDVSEVKEAFTTAKQLFPWSLNLHLDGIEKLAVKNEDVNATAEMLKLMTKKDVHVFVKDLNLVKTYKGTRQIEDQSISNED